MIPNTADFEAQRGEMLRLLEALVSVDSGSRYKAGTDRVTDLVAAELQAMGFALTRHPQREVGDHLEGTWLGPGQGHLLVITHADTVWPEGTVAGNPFRVEGGHALGPGVGDMKAGIVEALFALRELQRRDLLRFGQVTFWSTGDEELGSPSARARVEAIARTADYAVVMEPPPADGAITTSRHAVGVLEIEVRGRTAHAARGDGGISAIHELGHKIARLHGLTDRAAGRSVNVGVVRGGSARQVVADDGYALVDLRARSREVAAGLEAAIREIVERSTVAEATAALRLTWTRPPAERTEGNARLFRLAQEVGRGLGLELAETASYGGSDGNFTTALGVPTLDAMGPPCGRICSRDEYIVVDEFPRRAALLAGVLVRLSRGAW